MEIDEGLDDGARMSETPIAAVVLDLDGVIRYFDIFHRASVEMRHGLADGILWNVAFSRDLLEALVTGQITRAEWGRRIGAAVGNPIAAEQWLAAPVTVDQGVLEVVDQVRARGLPAAILTNGTDTIPTELDELGLTNRFDTVFNSAEIGVAKPDPRIFEHVCQQLGLPPEAIFYTDDSAGHVAAATEMGMVARRFVDAETLRQDLDRVLSGTRARPRCSLPR